MKKIYLLIAAITLLLCFSILIIVSNDWKQDNKISKITINGLRLIDKNELIGLIDTMVIGKKYNEIDIKQIDNKLKTNKYVRDVEISLNNDKVDLVVHEKKIIAYLLKESNLNLLSEELDVLPMNFNIQNKSLPIFHLKNSENEKNVKKVFNFFETLEKEEFIEIKMLISDIFYDTKKDEVELILNQSGLNVKLGGKYDWEKNIKKFKIFWKNILIKQNINFTKIDLRWEKKIIVS